MNREQHIRERFNKHFTEIGVDPTPMILDDWLQLDHQDNLRVRHGIRRVESDLRGRFCPELINLQTEHLTDRELKIYLDALQFAVDIDSESDKNIDTAVQDTDAELAERAPGSLRLMTQVQMEWLDRRPTDA